jgi:hypothetical protein
MKFMILGFFETFMFLNEDNLWSIQPGKIRVDSFHQLNTTLVLHRMSLHLLHTVHQDHLVRNQSTYYYLALEVNQQLLLI